jgi:hypothetical protein
MKQLGINRIEKVDGISVKCVRVPPGAMDGGHDSPCETIGCAFADIRLRHECMAYACMPFDRHDGENVYFETL